MIDWNKISEEDPETFWEILDWHEKLGTQWQFAEITELGMLRFMANTGAAYIKEIRDRILGRKEK